MATLQVSPEDRDLMIRTIIGEAGGQDLDGMAGVANVIANRLSSGKYGKTGADVVLAPNQFEPWTNRGAELLGYDPKSPEYQNAGAVLDGVLGGKVIDNTGGATHFYAPALQSQLGRATPGWATGQGKLIAGQLYYAPQGPVSRASSAPASQAISAVTQPKKATTWADVQADAAAGDKAITAATAAGNGALPDGSKAGKQTFDALKAFGVDDSDSVPVAAQPRPVAAKSAATATAPPAPPVRSFDALKAFGVDVGEDAAPAPAPVVTSGKDTGAASAFNEGVINGIPVLGPALTAGEDYIGSHIGSMISGKPVAQVLAEGQARRAATEAAHPVANVGGNLTGATMALGPIAGTDAGAAALGLRGGMGARTVLGTLTGGAIGTADAAARGEDAVAGGAFGALGGGLGPWAGRGIGYLGNLLTDTAQKAVPTGIPGVSRSAANIANQLIDWSGGHGAVAARADQLGSLATLADVDPSLTAIAGGLASKPGEAQGIIRNALTQRASGSGDRIAGTLSDVVGPDPGSVQSLDRNYAQTRSLADAASYPVIHATAPPVDAHGVLATIDQQMQHATGPQRSVLERFQRELDRAANVTPAVIDPASGQELAPEVRTWDSRTLHNLRQDLDNLIRYGDQSTGVQPGTLSRTQGAVGAMRSALDDTLKTQVPGMREADARSALNATNQNAVTEGYNSVMGANIPHPEDFASARADNNPATNAAMNAGMASRIYRAFGTGTQRDAVTLNKLLAGGEEGFSAQNLANAFSVPGPDGPGNRASALLDTLAREQAFNNTTNSVINNSETARRTAANKLLDETQPGGTSVLGATTAGMIAQPVKSLIFDPIVRAIMENPTAPRNVELARILIAQGGERGQFLERLQRLAGRNALVDRIGRPAADALNAAANRLLFSGGLVAAQTQGQ